MKHYFIWWTCFSFLHVFKENLAEVPNIIVEDQCVQYSGTATITCTFSSITIGNILLINWYGPGGNSDRLVFSGTDIKPAKYNGQNTATTLSLTIKNVDASDIGNYTCEYSGDTGQITFSQTHIEDIKCVNSVGGTEQITIHIESNNVAGVWQEAVVTNDAGDTIRANCSYDPVGQFSEGTCKFTGIAAGKYNYMVYSHGNCELNCTNAADITVDASPVDDALPVWAIIVIVLAIILACVLVAVLVYFKCPPSICVKNRPTAGAPPPANGKQPASASWKQWIYCAVCCNGESKFRRSINPAPPRTQPEGEASSPRLETPHLEVVSRQDVSVTTDKNSLPKESLNISPPPGPEDVGPLQSTGPVMMPSKLPPLDPKAAFEAADLETVDEVQEVRKKKKKKRKRKKRTQESVEKEETENKHEEEEDEEELKEVETFM